MPPLPVAPGVLRLKFTGTYTTAKWVNIMHIKTTGAAPVSADLSTLCTSLSGIWNTRFAPLMAANSALTGVELRDLGSDIGQTGVSAIGHPGQTSLTNSYPASVAIVVSWLIGRHYRGGHPRTYITAQIPANTINPTSWSTAWQNTVQAAMHGFIADVNALTATSAPLNALCSLSYYQHKVLRSTPAVDLITEAAVHNRIDTQRRRLGKET